MTLKRRRKERSKDRSIKRSRRRWKIGTGKKEEENVMKEKKEERGTIYGEKETDKDQ